LNLHFKILVPYKVVEFTLCYCRDHTG